MEAGKKRLAGDIVRQANTGEVTDLRREARDHPVGGAIAPSGQDVTETLELALQASGCDQADVTHKPRLLSDNGPSYISSDLADWLSNNGMSHVRGAPYHPQTQGKIERWHQTLKNRILLENYFLPGDLEKPDASRCLLRTRAINTGETRKDQEKDHRETSFALSTIRRVI